MTSRRFGTLVTLAVVAGLLSGCVGEPAPAETTPAFVSEDEAFAAAEETYRAYVDAVNQVDLSDPETFEPVFALTTGEANAAARESFSQMHADGWAVAGDSIPTVIEDGAQEGLPDSLQLSICLVVSDVRVLDSEGASVVSDDRGDVHSMTIHLDASRSAPDGWLVSEIEGREGDPTCGSE
ncbi:hypothetical protein ACPW96_10655 [Micromonospora sp. DT81.3]|uniref:hypothetical protein n=1 Tax=Micromonospora sp. DT81.3 TaxID=3416523 RepID=UPI003CE82992